MRTVADIDKEISELQKKLRALEGRPTEVYSRIVGYYRSLKNWNRGKREEYTHRVVFNPQSQGEPHRDAVGTRAPGETAAADGVTGTAATDVIAAAGMNATAQTESDELKPVEYMYFYRETCPNCPPVRRVLSNIELPGTETDVDTEAGTRAALDNGIYTTPTVVFFNSQHTEIYRASTIGELSELKIPQMA